MAGILVRKTLLPGSAVRLKDKRSDDRYSRQVLFEGIGFKGQDRLARASVVLVGCGALGALQAELLVRAGVGRLRISSARPGRGEQPAAAGLANRLLPVPPKAVAAERRLREINSAVRLEPCVDDLQPESAARLLGGFDLILDATDSTSRHAI